MSKLTALTGDAASLPSQRRSDRAWPRNARVRVDRGVHDVVIAHVTGELDALGAPALRQCVVNCLGTARGLVIDLGDVAFLGSAGLSVLVESRYLTNNRGTPWAVVANRHAVTRPLQVTGLERILPIHRSLAQAQDAVAEKVATSRTS